MPFILAPPSRLLVTREELDRSDAIRESVGMGKLSDLEKEDILESAEAEISAILKNVGLYGAKRKNDGSLRLYNRLCSRKDPKTGTTIRFRPEELVTPEIRNRLESHGWSVVHSSAFRWREVWRG